MASATDQTVQLPPRARVVIIGGGVVGCSVAYHLTRLGWEDVVVLERKTLTGGSTFHAAGLVGQLRSSASITQLLKCSVDLYSRLEEETGQATGWKANGGLRLACNNERLAEIKRQATTAHSFGLEMYLLSPNEARELWPMMEVSDVVGAAFLPTDGQASPSDLCQALAKGAKMEGAHIIEGCRVTGFDIRDGRVAGLQTELGDIECEIAVNCCGIWACECGRLVGVSVPVQPMQHQYLITEPIEGVTADLPTLRVTNADLSTVYRVADGALSPLEGPMKSEAWNRALDEGVILSKGERYAWTIPLALPATDEEAASFTAGASVAVKNEAGTVVAINNSARAPIFRAADFGIVGDYAEIVPALAKALRERRRESGR